MPQNAANSLARATSVDTVIQPHPRKESSMTESTIARTCRGRIAGGHVTGRRDVRR